MKTKTCKKCGEVKLKTEFDKRKDSIDGYRHICRVCRIEKNKEWNKVNRKKLLLSMRKWRRANQEKIKAYKKMKRIIK